MRILVNIFAFFGALSALVGILMFVYSLNFSGEKASQVPKKDTLFVLNWGGLDNTQDYKVLHSYRSPPHFMGDHLEYYCLQLESFKPNSRNASNWVFGIEKYPLVNEARKLVASTGKADKCFNETISGIEESIAAYVWGIHINGRHVSGAQVILYHKLSNRLLYVSFET